MSQSKFQVERIKVIALGGKLTRNDGEYRVTIAANNSKDYQEAIAYYTDDLDDAIATFHCMMREAK